MDGLNLNPFLFGLSLNKSEPEEFCAHMGLNLDSDVMNSSKYDV